MADDVDMDAPQISTLREETTPEPNPAKSTKFRVKLLVNDKAEGSRAGSISSKHGRAESDDEDDEEDEDEEDAQRRRSSIDNYTGISIKVCRRREPICLCLPCSVGIVQLEGG